MKAKTYTTILFLSALSVFGAAPLQANAQDDSTKHPLIYINTNSENASQLDWEIDSEGVVQERLNYDHERSSPNRANGHWHFQVIAEQGSELTIVLKDFENIWNGMRGIPISENTNTLV